ncbi:hypothetical protein [Arenivirga flava]|uniref:Uncharacterized protein n=1 Tax=Arenivirga flava TaxID=1930060 RepID=A0AA37UP20_9MICO|nr:hypothetical protein [Arenivirga flava]GMA28506.1 hypothetical protein GCM10025874_17590 [Arenivirga flava]
MGCRVPTGAANHPNWSNSVLDILYAALIVAAFALVALVAKGVEKL